MAGKIRCFHGDEIYCILSCKVEMLSQSHIGKLSLLEGVGADSRRQDCAKVQWHGSPCHLTNLRDAHSLWEAQLLGDSAWAVRACMLSHFSHVRLCAALWTVAPPGSSVHGILQSRMLEWVAFPSPGTLPDPGIEPLSLVPCTGGRVLYHWRQPAGQWSPAK